jgi:hypothetical protein
MEEKIEHPEGLIYERISAVMAEMKAIGKDQRNEMQKYKFRGIDDIYNELHSILAKHQVFSTSEILKRAMQERTTKNGGLQLHVILEIRYRFFTIDGSCVETETIGESMDTGDKAHNKSMAAAHKYALIQLFCIPTENKEDADFETHVIGEDKPLTNANVAKPAKEEIKEEKPKPIDPIFNKENINDVKAIQIILAGAKIPNHVWGDIITKYNKKPKRELVDYIKKKEAENEAL